MNAKICLIMLSMMILSSCSWFGDKEISPPAGIAADSLEYENYALCVTKCNQCEANCMDTTYFSKAIHEENKGMCDHITSLSLQEECKNMLLATEAVSELNKDKCLMLVEDQQESCLIHVSAEVAVQSQSVEKCSESPDVVRCQDIYYMDAARAEKNTAYCDNLSNEEKKQICYASVE